MSLALRKLEGILFGYPAWIRTKNNASKGSVFPSEFGLVDR